MQPWKWWSIQVRSCLSSLRRLSKGFLHVQSCGPLGHNFSDLFNRTAQFIYLCAFCRAALIAVLSVVFWLWGMLLGPWVALGWCSGSPGGSWRVLGGSWGSLEGSLEDLIYLKRKTCGVTLEMVVDTGAQLSVISAPLIQRLLTRPVMGTFRLQFFPNKALP